MLEKAKVIIDTESAKLLEQLEDSILKAIEQSTPTAKISNSREEIEDRVDIVKKKLDSIEKQQKETQTALDSLKRTQENNNVIYFINAILAELKTNQNWL